MMYFCKYNYHENEIFKGLSDEEQEACIYEVVKCVIDEVVEAKHYSEYVIVAKSIGAYPISNELLTRKELNHAKGIWLTPLLNRDSLFEKMKMCRQDSLYIIGDNDHCFVSDRFDDLS